MARSLERGRWLFASLLALGAAACAAVLGIDDPPLRSAAAPDAADAGPSDPCAHAAPPPPPAEGDAAESVPPFFLAVRTLRLRGEAGGVAGFDLDGVCTCDSRPETAAGGASSCKAPEPDCDDDAGVDNRTARFFGDYKDLFDIDQIAAYDTAAALGERTMLLHIAEYNGTPNDREVRIGIMPSRGILDGSGCGTTPAAISGRAPAGWCGRDRWSYLGALVVPLTKVPIQRVTGWVTGGVLVFRSDAPIDILVGETTTGLQAPMARGTLSRGADGRWRLDDGVLAGRLLVTDLLNTVGTWIAPREPDASRKYFCEVSAFDALKATVCKQADIRGASDSDLQPGACDAMSTAMRLTAEEADVGDEHTPAPEDSPCRPDRVDAGTYACPAAP